MEDERKFLLASASTYYPVLQSRASPKQVVPAGRKRFLVLFLRKRLPAFFRYRNTKATAASNINGNMTSIIRRIGMIPVQIATKP